MAINFLNYRHSHMRALWSIISGAGSKCRDWPGEDISEAEARAANGANWEARSPEVAEEQGGNEQIGRNTPGPADSAVGQRMDEASSSSPSAQFSVVPSNGFPCGDHQALLKTEGIPAQRLSGAAGQQQGRVSLPGSATARISHPQGRNAAETRGSL